MSGVSRAYADVGDGQLHYRVAGEAGRPVLLLLHQTPSTSAMYQPLMQRLADRFHLLAPDTPGFGGSDPLPGECSIAAFADTLSQWLEGLGIARCFVFGHHTGAAIAVQLACSRPGLCRALALSGPPLSSPHVSICTSQNEAKRILGLLGSMARSMHPESSETWSTNSHESPPSVVRYTPRSG